MTSANDDDVKTMFHVEHSPSMMRTLGYPHRPNYSVIQVRFEGDIRMERAEGLEPSTPSLGSSCSSQLSYARPYGGFDWEITEYNQNCNL